MIQKLFSYLFISLFFLSCGHNTHEKEVKAKRGEVLYSHGTAKLMGQEYPEALDLLMRAAADMPDDTRVHNNLGMAYYFMKRPATAIQHLQKALKSNPKNSDARNNLASIYFSQGQLEEAKKEYLAIQQDLIYRHQYRVKYNLALIHLRQGKKSEAVMLLKQAAEDKEDYCAANYQLGLLYQQTFNYSNALDWFQKASGGTCHGEPAPHYQQAEVLAAQNEYEKAQLKFEEVIERFPKTQYATLAQRKLIQLEQAAKLSSSRQINRPANTKTIQPPKF